MPYIGTSPSQGVRRVHTYTATANQTTFTGAGAEGATLSYKDSNFVDVYQNGVKLGDADYTATSGTSIVLGTGATVSDLVVIVAYDVFSAADTVSKADGGQFDGNVTMAGTLGVTGAVTANAGVVVDNITIDGTEIDLSSGDLTLDVASDIILDSDAANWRFKDAGTSILEIGAGGTGGGPSLYSAISDADMVFKGNDGGSAITALTLDMSDAGSATFSNRIRSSSGGSASAPLFSFSNNTGMYQVSGDVLGFSTSGSERMRIDSSGRVMIGNTTEGVAGADELTVGSTSGSNGITIRGGTSGTSSIYMSDATSGAGEYAGYIAYSHSGNTMAFATGSSERMRLTSGGAMTMGTTSSLTDVSGITLKHDDAGAYPTLLFLQNQPGSGGTMGADIHMGYASDYGTILRFFGNPFSSRPGGLQVRRVTGSGSSDLSFEIGTTGRTKIPNAYSETTGNSANLFVDTDGRLIRATSSERYKNTITDATHGLAEVLKLRSVTYKGNNDGDTVFGGLIAEEVHDAGLTEFVQYNTDNQPDALAYGNMVSLCIKAIQELKAENTALANRIAALEGE